MLPLLGTVALTSGPDPCCPSGQLCSLKSAAADGRVRWLTANAHANAFFSSTNLGIHPLHFVLLKLKLHEVVDDVEELGGHRFEVLVVVVLHRQRREDGVVDQSRPQVRQDPWGVLPRVFVKVLGYEVVQNRIPQEF